MTKNLLLSLALGVLLILGLASCGGEQEATPVISPTSIATSSAGDQTNPQQITITAKDNVFEPRNYGVQANKPIRLTVVNAGQNVHKVEVVDLLPETELAPGQSKTVDIPPQKPGTHKVYCEIHEDTGMEGQFIVQ